MCACAHRGAHSGTQENTLSMWRASSPEGILPRGTLMNQAQGRPPPWLKLLPALKGRRRETGGAVEGLVSPRPLHFHPDAPLRQVPQPTSFRSMRFKPEVTCTETYQAHLPDEASCPNSSCSLLDALTVTEAHARGHFGTFSH